jgi:hypothetical protein
VTLNAHELTTIDVMVGKEMPAAILLNSEDWGFGYFEMDASSIKVFENCLGKLDSKIDRAVIIGQVIAMMK